MMNNPSEITAFSCPNLPKQSLVITVLSTDPGNDPHKRLRPPSRCFRELAAGRSGASAQLFAHDAFLSVAMISSALATLLLLGKTNDGLSDCFVRLSSKSPKQFWTLPFGLGMTRVSALPSSRSLGRRLFPASISRRGQFENGEFGSRLLD
jgi:hypothetical protein